MARGIFDNLLNFAARAADKAIKNALREKKVSRSKTTYSNSVNQKSNYDVLKMVVDNRKRILNESSQLIDNSKNIKVIISRRDVAIEHLDWFIANEYNGIKLNPPAKQGKLLLLMNFNECLYKRIEEQINAQFERIATLKTKQAQENSANKALDILQTNYLHFDKSSLNFKEIEMKIEKLHERIENIEFKIKA